MTLPSITAAISSLKPAEPLSDLTLAPGHGAYASDPGTPVVLAAGRSFINNSGTGAIVESAIDPWQIYSASPAGDVFNGLDSGNTAVWNTTFGEPVTAAGNRYVFAFRPTITVTSGDLTKTFGQDVTSLVASDFTISGLQPGVGGAFLGDTAASIYSGTPSVTSLGSPASAPVAGSPYPITVAPGSFAVSDGYALDLNSAGRLTVAPKTVAFLPFDPGFLPGLTQINNPAQTEYDVGGYEQVLPRFTVACNEPPSLPDPNAFSDPDAALRAISRRWRIISGAARIRPRPRSPTRLTPTRPSCRSWRRDCRRRCAMFRRSSRKPQNAFALRLHEPRP